LGTREKSRPFAGFFAILYYEFLWNLRKKKTIGLFTLILGIAILEVTLQPLLSYYYGPPLANDPSFVYTTVSYPILGGILLVLVAIATAMNTVSGEFETGSIVPLLTKPVSKTTVFLGKVTGAFVTLLGLFALRGVILVIGGVITRGPQDNLGVVPVGVMGLTIAATVWTTVVIFLGTVSKNSLVAALGTFGIYLGLAIASAFVVRYLGQASILLYAPGTGAMATTRQCVGNIGAENPLSLGSGTDWLGRLLSEWIVNPSLVLNYCGLRFRGGISSEIIPLSSDPISTMALRSLGVGLAYIVGLLAISWYAFRRAQILE
jgi:ABC-type transport system involved in multi-copper enzyme maturation permease subunit